MKKVVLTILLIAMIVLLSGCWNSEQNTRRMTTAMIRYFDGSCDAFLINRYFVSGSGVITLYTTEGREVTLGQNNVIIIEESEDQYYGN